MSLCPPTKISEYVTIFLNAKFDLGHVWVITGHQFKPGARKLHMDFKSFEFSVNFTMDFTKTFLDFSLIISYIMINSGF